MDSINPYSVNNTSSFKTYILIVVFLMLAVMAVIPSVNHFQQNKGCEAYFNLAKEHGLTPSSCSRYCFGKYVVPSVAMASPFLFVLFILLFKEKQKHCQLTQSKQERISFWLLIAVVLLFLFSFILIKSIHCEGFGCLGLAPLIGASIVIFPPLILGFSLWFLKARYQWGKKQFLAVVIGLIILLLLAYAQTPLL
jgi:hypothetical protein